MSEGKDTNELIELRPVNVANMTIIVDDSDEEEEEVVSNPFEGLST